MDVLKDGPSWIDSKPEADGDGEKEKHKEIESVCAPIASQYYQGGARGAGNAGVAEDERRHTTRCK